jgi:hypothetical protein
MLLEPTGWLVLQLVERVLWEEEDVANAPRGQLAAWVFSCGFPFSYPVIETTGKEYDQVPWSIPEE